MLLRERKTKTTCQITEHLQLLLLPLQELKQPYKPQITPVARNKSNKKYLQTGHFSIHATTLCQNRSYADKAEIFFPLPCTEPKEQEKGAFQQRAGKTGAGPAASPAGLAKPVLGRLETGPIGPTGPWESVARAFRGRHCLASLAGPWIG